MRNLLLYFFSHRTLALLRWDFHFIMVRVRNTFFNERNNLNKRIQKQISPLYLNLGSGPRGLNNASWINIDGYKDKNVHFLCDFNRPLPFDAETFDGIFCEHVLEHFNYENGKKLLNECKRILKKRGVIRIIVPDGNKILSSYFDNPEFIVKYKECNTGYPIEAVNSWFYQRYEHQCIYDAGYLTDLLKNAGFTTTVSSEFKRSRVGSEEIVLDDPKYCWESLYVEAVK